MGLFGQVACAYRSSFGGDLALARQPDGGSWATGWVAPTRDAANAAAAAAGGSGGLGASLAASPIAGGVASCTDVSSHAQSSALLVMLQFSRHLIRKDTSPDITGLFF